MPYKLSNLISCWALLGFKVGLFCGLLWWLTAAAPLPAFASTSSLRINEVMVANGAAVMDMDQKEFSDYIEIYNPTAAAVNMGGLYLSDNPNDTRLWRIPDGTTIPAGGYLIFWADEVNSGNHTNFKLSSKGETITLSNSGGAPIDSINAAAVPQMPDIAYGRNPDGAATLAYFGLPTPGAANDSASAVTNATNRLAPVQFSLEGGFYSGSQTLILSTATAGTTIRYTTDGSRPTSTSTVYTAPITLNVNTVVRAQAFAPSFLPSIPATKTFFINETTTMAVISIATDPANLFDYNYGIHVQGATYNGSSYSGNYYQNWERPMSLEFYEPNGTLGFSLDGGISIHGYYSRRMPLKSFHIQTGDSYGSGDIKYQIFPDQDNADYNGFLLRNSGADQRKTMFRDALNHSMVEGVMDIDTQAYRPSIVFINGEYWGILNIREKLDEEYLEDNHGVDPQNVDFLKIDREVVAGDAVAYNALINFIKQNDMSNPANYAVVKDQVEIKEFMNYMIAQMYWANQDWPGNNIRYWRERTPTGEWRWVVYDTDFTLDGSGYNFDSLAWATAENGGGGGAKNPPWSTFLLRELLKSPEFKQEFIQRFAAHLNLTFEKGRVLGILEEIYNTMKPEMPRHIARVHQPESWATNSMATWNDYVEKMRDFIRRRVPVVFEDINGKFGLSGTSNLTINITPPGSGRVTIHDAEFTGNTFTGPFFKNIPIQLEADAAPGYRFVRWQETGVESKKTAVAINTNYVLTAVFEPYTPAPIVINEIHYNPSPAQGVDEDFEFIELYNSGATAVNLAGYRMTQGISYTFTSGIINPGEFIILTGKAANYAGNGYQVFQWDSLTGGKLNNGGEQLRLKDNFDVEVDDVTYGDGSSWPQSPDGDGPSLELISPALDNTLSDSWTASEELGGTPGRPNDDTPKVVIVQTNGHTKISEDGQTDTYYILLNTRPTSNVLVTVDPNSQADVGNGPSNPIVLTFTPANGLIPQTVTVAAVDDSVNEGPHTATISHSSQSSDGNYNALTIASVTAEITDNDVPGITVVQTAGNTAVAEGSVNDSISFVLNSKPTADVKIRINPDGQLDVGNGADNQRTLTFSPTNARTPQSVTVRAVDDLAAEGTHYSTLRITVETTDSNYSPLTVSDIVVVINDNDTPGITIVESNNDTTVQEGGTADSYTIVLETVPTSNVQIAVTPSNAQVNLGNGTGNPITLTFTPGNALTPQTVNVSALDDAVVEGLRVTDLNHTASSSDSGYNGLVIETVEAYIEDNDEPGVIVTESNGTAVTEGGAGDSYQIVLARQPLMPVEVSILPPPGLDLGNGPGQAVGLTFSPASALQPQTVHVTAVNDQLASGNRTYTILHETVSEVSSYDNLAVSSVVVSVVDDDVANVVRQVSTAVVKEGGAAATYSLALSSKPTHKVTIVLTPDNQLDLGEGAGQPITLTFTPDEALTAQFVSITAVDDGLAEGLHSGRITHTITSQDSVYSGMVINTLALTVQDAGSFIFLPLTMR